MIRQLLRGAARAAVAAGAQAPAPPPEHRWLDLPNRSWTVESAYAFCEKFAREHHETYPVASRFVPAEIRPHLLALYAFARAADDFADEPLYAGRRLEALDTWQLELDRCFHGEATHPIFIALADTIEKRDLPLPPFDDLLAAFRMDLEVRRYASFASLRGYTARSAEPVGRLLLALFGYRDPELVRFADEISTALQLANFWQDLAVDAARDHIYIPAEDLHFFGIGEAELKALRPSGEIRSLLRFQVARTRAHFEKGRPLLRKVGADLRLELSLIWLLGMALLDKIEACDFDVFTQRPMVRRRDQALVLARAAKHWTLDFDVKSMRKFF